MSDEYETDRLRELRDIKRQRLHELDKQAALLGDASVPPHVQMERKALRKELDVERAALRKELDIADAVVDRGPRAEFIEALGGSGRFGAYYAELRRANDGIALLGERVEDRFTQLGDKMNTHRQWIILIGVVVVVILVAGAVVVTIVVMRGV